MVLEKLLNYDKFQKEIEMKEKSKVQVVSMKKNKKGEFYSIPTEIVLLN